MPAATLRKALPLLCPALASLCLAAGYRHAGAWAAVVALLTFLLWMAARRWKALWTANLGLAAATAAAAAGLATGAPLAWMLPATALALSAWDLTLLEARIASNPPGVETEKMERAHYASLALALALGLLVVGLGQMVRFQIPFVVMLALVLVAYVSLERVIRMMGE